MDTIFLITTNFPFGKKETFVLEELNYLCKVFNVVVFPSNCRNTCQERKLPENAGVDLSLCEALSLLRNQKWRYLFSWIFLKYLMIELLHYPHVLLSYKKFSKLIVAILKARASYHWIKNYRGKEKTTTKIIFYTYWAGPVTLGLSKFSKNNDKFKSITRAHAADLYAYRNKLNYKPLQCSIFELVDSIFTISEHGKRYILNTYPKSDLGPKTIVARLGVGAVNIRSMDHFDNKFVFFSCSNIVPVKRIDKIINMIERVASKLPDISFYWDHIGGGELELDMMHLAREKLSLPNVNWKIHGPQNHNYVYDFLQKNCVDLFINLSDSEGLPVSIMEAQSFGIPAIATNVSGTNEIVNNQNGFLIDPMSNLEDIANQIINYIKGPMENRITKRKLSLLNFEHNFNAHTNYQAFVKELMDQSKTENT